jgi:hypothetical protein
VVPGGFVIRDEDGLKACAEAMRDYRALTGITDSIQVFDRSGIYWRKVTRKELRARSICVRSDDGYRAWERLKCAVDSVDAE